MPIAPTPVLAFEPEITVRRGLELCDEIEPVAAEEGASGGRPLRSRIVRARLRPELVGP